MREDALTLLREVADEYNLWGHPSSSLGVVMSRGEELRAEAEKADRRDALKHRVRDFLKRQS